jgi:hypothetical protein
MMSDVPTTPDAVRKLFAEESITDTLARIKAMPPESCVKMAKAVNEIMAEEDAKFVAAVNKHLNIPPKEEE